MVEEDHSVRRLRMARINDILLLDHPADVSGPRSINAYLVEVLDFTAAAASGADAKRVKIDPQGLLYSLRWLHNGKPPDFHLQLVRDPRLWFDFVAAMLLGALTRYDPQLGDKLRAATAA